MAEFVFAAQTDDIPASRGKTITLGDKKIALFNVDGAFYAIDNTCLHRGGPLGEGELVGCVVTCPWHGWKFDVRSGEMTMNPATRVNATRPVLMPAMCRFVAKSQTKRPKPSGIWSGGPLSADFGLSVRTPHALS